MLAKRIDTRRMKRIESYDHVHHQGDQGVSGRVGRSHTLLIGRRTLSIAYTRARRDSNVMF